MIALDVQPLLLFQALGLLGSSSFFSRLPWFGNHSSAAMETECLLLLDVGVAIDVGHNGTRIRTGAAHAGDIALLRLHILDGRVPHTSYGKLIFRQTK